MERLEHVDDLGGVLQPDSIWCFGLRQGRATRSFLEQVLDQVGSCEDFLETSPEVLLVGLQFEIGPDFRREHAVLGREESVHRITRANSLSDTRSNFIVAQN